MYPEGRCLFVTTHLHGVAPSGRLPPPGKVTTGEQFVLVDRYLDRLRTGPRHLHQPEIPRMVADVLQEGESLGRYDLHAWVLMGNHMHVLFRPHRDVSYVLRSLKGYTARQANRLLGQTGESFWQHESYDHWVRNEPEWERIRSYIERNPVKAGLVERPEDWAWSSAAPRQ